MGAAPHPELRHRPQEVTFDAILSGATAERVTVDGAVRVDRTGFGMTWSPMRMASSTAVPVIHAQFVKCAAKDGKP